LVNQIKIIYFALHFIRLFKQKKQNGTMSKICQVTGKKAVVGNNVSHSRRIFLRRDISCPKKKGGSRLKYQQPGSG